MQADTPSDKPESLSPFLTTAQAVDALNRLERGLGARRPLLLVTGQSGTGKSTLAREALGRWGERVSVACLDATDVASLAHSGAASVAAALLAAFGGTLKPGTPAFSVPERLLETLANATAGGRVAVVLVDGADALPDDVLLEFQRLAARAEQRQCPLELMLVGSAALAQRVEAGSLAALGPDVSVRVKLEPLTPHDTRHYLLQRPAGPRGAVMFSRKACRDIHTAGRGRIRDIEAIAAEAARRARKANATTVSPEHVRAAAQAVRARRPSTPVSVTPDTAPPAVVAAVAPPEPEPAPVAQVEPVEATPEDAAEHEPEPVAQGSHVEAEVSASAAAGTAGDSGEFRPSDDPRVKDWLQRFGGAGVRIGAHYAPSSSREVESFDDSAGDVRPLGGANAASAPETPAARPAAGATAVSSQSPWHAEASTAEPAAWPPPRALPRTGPVLGRKRDSAFVWQASTLVLGLALVAVLIGQRRLAPHEPRESTAEIAPADSAEADAVPRQRMTRPKRAPKRTPSRQAKAEAPEVVTVRYTVAVGTFLDADMARAERDHLARLIPHRVWVSSSSVGGVRSFRIQFGAFASRDEAETAAQKLLRQGLLRDASVLELPRAD